MNKKLNLKHPYPLLAGLLLLASALFIYHRFIFGDELWAFMERDIGSDTVQQYLPHYHTIVNHIREGTFAFWDFNNGFGTNMFNLNMFDPALMVVYALGVAFGTEHLAYYLVYVQITQILLAGLVFYQYLSCFSFSGKTKCIVSYIYGLNGFLMVWGQHYQFGMAAVYLPLLLWMAERCIRRRRFSLLFVLSIFLAAVYSTYLGYMMFVCLGFYLLVRLFGMERMARREKWRMLGILYGSMLLGIGMGAFAVFPTAFTIFGISSRLETKAGLLERIGNSLLPYYKPIYYKTLFYKFFSSYLEGLTQVSETNVLYTGAINYYEDPNVFCSTLFLVLGCQYVCCLNRLDIPKRQKPLRFCLLGLLAFCLLLPFCGLVMNGFSTTINRHTFLMMPFFCLIMAHMLQALLREQVFSYVGLAGAFLLLAFVFMRKYPSITFLSHKRNLAILTVTGILMIAVVFCLAKFQAKQAQTVLYGFLFCLVVVNMVSEGYTSTLERILLHKDDDVYFGELYSQDVQDALDWLKERDPEFYRVEKTFENGSLCMDSLLQGYRGVSSYNSTMNRNIIDFTSTIYREFLYRDKNHYRFRMIKEDQRFADLCGIRYLLCREYEKDGSFNKSGYRLIKRFGEIEVYENKDATSLGRFYSTAVTRKEFEKYVKTYGRQKAKSYIMDHLVLEGQAQGQPREKTSSGGGEASSTAVSIEAPEKDSYLVGTVDAPQDGYVMFTIPFEKGWEIYVDGEKQEILKANLGFQGIAVKKGEHQLELKYHPPGFSQGLAVSILCWLTFLFLSIRLRLSQRLNGFC